MRWWVAMRPKTSAQFSSISTSSCSCVMVIGMLACVFCIRLSKGWRLNALQANRNLIGWISVHCRGADEPTNQTLPNIYTTNSN